MFLVVILFALFASVFTLQKEALEYCEPFFLIGSRMFFAGIFLLLYLFLTNKKALKIRIEHLGLFILLGIFAVYLTNICEIWGIQYMVSSKACLIYSLSPFISALIAYILLKEKLSKQKILGMLVGFVGLIPVHFIYFVDTFAKGDYTIQYIAEGIVVGAVFFSVYGWVLFKRIINEYKYSPLLINGISMIIGGILALIHSFFSGEVWNPTPVIQVKHFIITSISICLISNVICYNLYGYLLQKFTVTFMSLAGLLTPFFASLYGYVFLKENITWHFFASVIIFLLGMILFYKDEAKVSLQTNLETCIL
jgi:drug/metabolite transporter (DMT)-like permease